MATDDSLLPEWMQNPTRSDIRLLSNLMGCGWTLTDLAKRKAIVDAAMRRAADDKLPARDQNQAGMLVSKLNAQNIEILKVAIAAGAFQSELQDLPAAAVPAEVHNHLHLELTQEERDAHLEAIVQKALEHAQSLRSGTGGDPNGGKESLSGEPGGGISTDVGDAGPSSPRKPAQPGSAGLG